MKFQQGVIDKYLSLAKFELPTVCNRQSYFHWIYGRRGTGHTINQSMKNQVQ